MTRRRKIAYCLIVVPLLLGGYCFNRYRQEQEWLARKSREIVEQAGAHTRREQVMALRDYIRRTIESIPQMVL